MSDVVEHAVFEFGFLVVKNGYVKIVSAEELADAIEIYYSTDNKKTNHVVSALRYNPKQRFLIDRRISR